MRILPKLALLFAVFFLVVSAISAQQKKAVKADIDTLETKAREMLKSISYREKILIIDSEDRRLFHLPEDHNLPHVISSFNRTTEYLHPDRMHSFSEDKWGKLPIVRFEQLRIGENRYQKLDNEAWTLPRPLPPDKESLDGKLADDLSKPHLAIKCGSKDAEEYGIQTTKECESLGIKKIGTQITQAFRITETTTTKRISPEIPGSILLDARTFWLDKQGRFLKIETVRTVDLAPERIWRAVVEYEYDPPNLKIEAPIK